MMKNDSSEENIREDALGHTEAARVLLGRVRTGTSRVIAVQGDWGRGKTDVLRRAYAMATSDSSFCGALWIDPWRYRDNDLLTPLVVALINALPQEAKAQDKQALKEAAEGLLGGVLGLVSKTGGEFVSKLFDAKGKTEDKRKDQDPATKMGQEFARLVEAVRHEKTGQLLVFVDDVDRCLPEKQIGLLEAFHFLDGSGANVVFILAIDPGIVRSAVRAHYKTVAFDADRYLDKMISLRMTLAPLTEVDATRLARARIVEAFQHPDEREIVLADSFKKALSCSPKFRNPRLIERTVQKVVSTDLYELREDNFPGFLSLVFVWALFCEAWPEARDTLYNELAFGRQFSESWSQVIRLDKEKGELYRFAYSVRHQPYLGAFSPTDFGQRENGWRTVLEAFQQAAGHFSRHFL